MSIIINNRELAGGGGQISHMALAVLFIIIGLILGAFMRELHKTKLKVPYTPILLAIGILIGGISGKIGTIGDSAELLAGIDPEGILLIFIPILVFESAFNADWHIFKRSFYQIFLLALPGVIISFTLIAGSIKYILGYDDSEFDWYSAFTFGTIVATTDPVAVVALLRELGAPVYFSTIIEGESLLNDGTAVVFYSIFVKLAKGGESSIGAGIGSFFTLISGGVALGLIGGLLLSYWLERILKDSTLAITITIGTAYLVFFLAEELPVKFSGILALVTLGLYMSAVGKVKISCRIEHTLHAVIGWTQYASETLIFFLTGILVGINIFSNDSSITGTDWWKMIVFFLLSNLIRAINVAILYVFMKRGSYKLTFKEYIVMIYGGLRGSLGLALALITSVEQEFQGEKKRTGELILFMMAGTATLSLLVNGTTTGLLVKKIKMVKENPARAKTFRSFVREIDAENAVQYEKLREQNHAAVCDWQKVKELAGVTDEIIKQNLATQSNLTKQPSRHFSLNPNELMDDDILAECRHRMLTIFLRLVWERYDESQMQAQSADILNKAVKVAHDDLSQHLSLFEFMYNYYVSAKTLTLMAKLSKAWLIGRFFKKVFANHFIFLFDSATSLISIIDQTKHFLEELTLPAHVIHKVYSELEFDKKEANSYLNKMEGQFIEVIRFLTTKRYTMKILARQRKQIVSRFQKGEFESSEYEHLIQIVDKRAQDLHQLVKIKWEPPSFDNMLMTFPLFNLLTASQLEKLKKSSQPQSFKMGDRLFTTGQPCKAIYLILQGEVEVLVPERTPNNRKGVGHIISFINLVVPDGMSRIDCIVSSPNVKVQALSIPDLKEIIAENPQFEKKVIKGALVYLRFMNPDKAIELMKLSEKSVKHLIQTSEIIVFNEGDRITFPHGGFVLKGKFQHYNMEFDEYSLIPKLDNPIKAKEMGKVVKFSDSEMKVSQSSVNLVPHESQIKIMSSQVRLMGSPRKEELSRFAEEMKKNGGRNIKQMEDFVMINGRTINRKETRKKLKARDKKSSEEKKSKVSGAGSDDIQVHSGRLEETIDIPEEQHASDQKLEDKYVDGNVNQNDINRESFINKESFKDYKISFSEGKKDSTQLDSSRNLIDKGGQDQK